MYMHSADRGAQSATSPAHSMRDHPAGCLLHLLLDMQRLPLVPSGLQKVLARNLSLGLLLAHKVPTGYQQAPI